MPIFAQIEDQDRCVIGARVPDAWEDSPARYSLDRSVVDLFRERAASAPAAIAIEQHPRSMTYADLNGASDRVAFELQQRGLQPEEPVAVILPPGCEFIAAILGVLKAGGCYLPLTWDTPDTRLNFILNDCKCRFELTDCEGEKRLRGRAGEALNVPRMLSEDAKILAPQHVPSDPNRRAYIACTSGSTGQPKGVQVEHRSLSNLVFNYIEQLQLGPRDRSSMLAYLAFDVSMADIWPVLCAGGTVVIPQPGLRYNPDELIAWLAAMKLTLAFIPTGLAEVLFSRPWPPEMALRFLTTGGDRLRVRPPSGLPFIVVNGYGPTECTVFATWAEIAPSTPAVDESDAQSAPPIGRPLHNVTAYVLDAKQKRVPVGVEGELFLGGVQVARGYLQRDELTAKAFLLDPFAKKTGVRMYRTGDYARWLPGGELEFLGRRDTQIKVRGGRIELSGIETLLFAHEHVLQACCVPYFDHEMPMGVVAHIVPNNPAIDLSKILRPYLAERLAAYMLPAFFVAHSSLPLTPQGKIDRAALQALPSDAALRTRELAGGDNLDAALEHLWNDMLPATAGIQPDLTFGELGGDSLLAIKLLLRVEELSARHIDFATFANRPTLAGLQAAVRQSTLSLDSHRVVPLRREGARPPLFCLYSVSGGVNVYEQLAEAFGPDQPVYGIRSPAYEDPRLLPQSIEEAATEALAWIRKIQPQGAPALIGYSWGGLLGFEIARQLWHRNGTACFCAMLGTSAPPRPTSAIFRMRHFATAFPAWLMQLLRDTRNLTRRLSRWREMARNTRCTINDPVVSVPDWAQSRVSIHFLRLATQYQPLPPSPIEIHFFRERDAYSPRPHPLTPYDTDYLIDGGWGRWTSVPAHVHWLNGDHLTILTPPHVALLAKEIRASMDRHMQSSARSENGLSVPIK